MALHVSGRGLTDGKQPLDHLVRDFIREGRLEEFALDEMLARAAEDNATETEARLVDTARKAIGRRFLIDMTLCVMAIGVGAMAVRMVSVPVLEPQPELFSDRMMQVEILLRQIMDLKEGFIY